MTDESGVARWLDRAAILFFLLMVLSCPYSIAAAQTSWLIGLLASIIRLTINPQRKIGAGALGLALWIFAGWSLVSAAFSYDPATSLDKMRSVGLFLVLFFAVWNIRNVRTAWIMSFALIVACTVVAAIQPIRRMVGRGVQVHGIRPDGPLASHGFADGDTLLKVNGKTISDPSEVLAAFEANESIKVRLHRPDAYLENDIPRADLLPGTTAAEKLGFTRWSKGHYWRVQGFFSHYMIFSEVLQLIGSLAIGLFLVFFQTRRRRPEELKSEDLPTEDPGLTGTLARVVTSGPFLLFTVAAIGLALILTSTRGSQLALLVSGFVMIAVSQSRKFLFVTAVVALPFVLGGLMLLQQSRQVGFIDRTDDSTQYRLTMWRDGARLFTASPRNAVFGVGMDSIKTHWQEWGMYDDGRMIKSHFHSTPIQILVERGLPGLLIWLTILGIYARTLWRGLRANRDGDWRTRGILLGSLGGLIGFITSGFVQSNIVDSVVAMIFYLIMGLSLRVAQLSSADLQSPTQ